MDLGTGKGDSMFGIIVAVNEVFLLTCMNASEPHPSSTGRF
jgi:hypothetical protein